MRQTIFKHVLRGSLLVLFTASCAANEPLVIAHRGASGYLPEHTLPAVSLAYGMGADYIEQDLVLSKDHVPVVLHDIHIDTVTNVAGVFPTRRRSDGRWYALDFTLAELKTLRVNERVDAKTGKPVFGKRFPHRLSPFRIATLAEELEMIQGLNHSTGRQVGIYPEIKNPKWHHEQGADITRVVVEALKKYGYDSHGDRCFLQCFEQAELRRLRHEMGVELKLIQLLGSKPKRLLTKKGLKEISAYADGIGPSLSTVLGRNATPNLVSMAHEAGLLVHPYTFRVDAMQPEEFSTSQNLLRAIFDEARVDGVFTDFPDVCVKYLKSR